MDVFFREKSFFINSIVCERKLSLAMFVTISQSPKLVGVPKENRLIRIWGWEIKIREIDVLYRNRPKILVFMVKIGSFD